MTAPHQRPPLTVDNPFFARIWPTIAAHETEQIRALRRENLAGLSGRVLEVGAGIGTNFPLYPDSVAQVVAVEPEHRLAVRARDAAADATRSGRGERCGGGGFLGRRAI